VSGGPNLNHGPAFAVTRDGGIVWRLDSGIGGARIFKMDTPAPDHLWAFIGHSNPRGPNLASIAREGTYADSLFFSSDQGTTWYKDAKSFAGVTMVDMFWADSAHGYILSMRDNSTYISRWVPDVSSVAKSALPEAAPIRILESPVGQTLSIATTLEGVGEITILDLLGRTQFTEHRSLDHRVDLAVVGLDPGFYVIRVHTSSGTFALRFIKR
jgi:hypothetical protein